MTNKKTPKLMACCFELILQSEVLRFALKIPFSSWLDPNGVIIRPHLRLNVYPAAA